jgi:hypothetical protein
VGGGEEFVGVETVESAMSTRPTSVKPDRWESSIDLDRSDWLASQQAGSAVRGSTWEFLGLVSPKIIVSNTALESRDTETLLLAVEDFVVAMENDAFLRPGEYPIESLYSFFASFYGSQILNGGHGQWVRNVAWDRSKVLSTAYGLKRMGAEEYLNILLELITLLNGRDRPRAERIMSAGGFGDPDPQIELLDDRFFELGQEHLDELNSTYLINSGLLEVVADDYLKHRLTQIAQSNPLADQRAAAIAERRKHIFSPPQVGKILKDLCGKSNIILNDFAADNESSIFRTEDLYVWPLATSVGKVFAVAIRVRHAVGFDFHLKLVDKVFGQPKLLGEMKLTRAEFEELDTKDIPIGMVISETTYPFD